MAVNNFNKATNKFINESRLELFDNLRLYLIENLEIEESILNPIFEKYKTEKINISEKNKDKNKNKKEKRTRKPSQYNLYIGQKMREIKEQNKDINSKELMRLATQAWTLDKNN